MERLLVVIRRHQIAALGVAMAALGAMLFSGCAVVPETAAARSESPRMPGGQLLEVVTIISDDGSRSSAVLTRSDIAAADANLAASANWRDLSLSRSNVIEAIRRTHYGTPDRPGKPEYAELYFRGCIIRHQYTLADLNVRNGRELLEKYFERRGDSRDGWWMRKLATRSEVLEENGLIALLKDLGFEATRTDLAPTLFVKPPPALR